MSKLPKHLLGLADGDLESMCVNCGLCCWASAPVGKSSVFIPELRCKHLDFDSGKACCSVYDKRHEVAKGWCLPLAEAIEKGVFPKSCPYVRDVQDYVGSVALPDEQYEAIRPALKKALEDGGKPTWVSDSLWKTFLDQK